MDIESQDTTRQRRVAFLGDSKSSGDLKGLKEGTTKWSFS